MPSSLYTRATYTGAKTQNTEWAGTDYEFDEGAGKCEICTLQLALSVTSSIIEVTLNSGTNWYSLNSGVALTIGQLYQFDIIIQGGDAFNIRATNAAGTTVVTAKLVSDIDG